MKPHIKTLLVLLVLLISTLLAGLGDRPVSKIQEVRIAETAREMLASGDWILPRYNGELRLQKPPLPYWVTAASYQLLGVNANAVRLPAVLFGLLSAFLLFTWSRRATNLTVAANSVLVLVASYLGIRYFRSGEADAMLLFFISAACMLGYDMLYGEANSLRRIGLGLVLGLGFLAKGPAALAIPLLVLLALALMDKRWGKFKACFSLTGLLILGLVAFGWYAWMFWTLPDAAQHFFGKQMDETFVSGTHAKPAWWYLAHTFEFFAPWGFLLIPAAWWSYAQRQSAGVLPTPLRFAWIWLCVVFVLLTFTVNKQMQYALLFAPPLAIILGYYLTHAEGGFARTNRILFWIFCVAALAALAYAAFKSNAGALASLAWPSLLLLPMIMKRALSVDAPSVPILLVASVTAVTYLYSEAYFSKEPRKIAAQTLVQQASSCNSLYQAKPGDGAISFYSGHVVPPVGDEEIPGLLQARPEICFVTGQQLAPGKFSAQLMAESGELKLYRLRTAP
jgi:4-amino-4-deoxy-L-arabinose transferase-like glycosyltransferase